MPTLVIYMDGRTDREIDGTNVKQNDRQTDRSIL